MGRIAEWVRTAAAWGQLENKIEQHLLALRDLELFPEC